MTQINRAKRVRLLWFGGDPDRFLSEKAAADLEMHIEAAIKDAEDRALHSKFMFEKVGPVFVGYDKGNGDCAVTLPEGFTIKDCKK